MEVGVYGVRKDRALIELVANVKRAFFHCC